MDMSARIAAYQKQNGRLKLTDRQLQQVMRMKTRELAELRRIQARLAGVISGRPDRPIDTTAAQREQLAARRRTTEGT